MAINVKEIKKDFPILAREFNGKRLVYLDNAATSQKPRAVIDAISDYYSNHNANIHRGIYSLSEEATLMYENARKKVANFLGARRPEEIIFTKGTTESLNRVAISWGLQNLKKGDVVLLTNAEHHSNLVPWQEEAKVVGAKIDFVKVDKNGEISLDEVKKKLNKKVKLVSICHASNVLGTIFPVKGICKLAKEVGAIVVVDGAQAIPHMKVNVSDLGCDFYAFSAHKMLGPTGIGVLWGRKELLEKLEPYEYGGGMIEEVNLEKSTWAKIPEKFEAGTPNVEGAVGLKAAIEYLEKLGMDNVREHETELTEYALKKLKEIKEIKILGPMDARKRCGLVSFTCEGVHPHDMAAVLNTFAVAVRAGQHCAKPLHDSLGILASTRVSFSVFNTKKDVDVLVEGIKKAIKIFK